MLFQEIPLDQIRIGARTRKEIRNVNSLAESIRARGLLQPIVVRRDAGQYMLVAGGRRIEAVRTLGRSRIDAHVAETLNDELEALLAEGEENTEREPFTPTEAVEHAERIEAIEKARAAERRLAGQRAGGPKAARARTTPGPGVLTLDFVEPGIGDTLSVDSTESVEVPPARTRAAGETRNRVAKSVGMSAPKLAEAKRVIAIANDPATPEPVRAEAIVAQRHMDETGNVHGALKRVELAAEKHAMTQAAEARANDAAPVGDYLIHDMETQRKAAIAAFMKALPRTATLAAFAPEEVALVLDEDCMTALYNLRAFIDNYCDRIEKIRAETLGR